MKDDKDTMQTVFSTSEQQVKLYVQLMDEQWKRDHVEAQACVDLEEKIAFGVYLYERLVHLIDEWKRKSVQAALECEDWKYSESGHESCEQLMRWWMRPCEDVEQRIQFFERRNFKVDKADKFRSYCAEAHWFLSSPEEVAASPEMQQLADASRGAHARGETTED